MNQQQNSTTETTTSNISGVIHLTNQEPPVEEVKENTQVKPKKKPPTRSIQWTEETIDNENLGRLKSNLCCIYHKPKDAEQPSSDTCTSDDDGNELDRDRITKKRHKKSCRKHGDSCGGHHGCANHKNVDENAGQSKEE